MQSTTREKVRYKMENTHTEDISGYLGSFGNRIENTGRGLTYCTHLVRDAHHCVFAEYLRTAGMCPRGWMAKVGCGLNSRALLTIKQLYWPTSPALIRLCLDGRWVIRGARYSPALCLVIGRTLGPFRDGCQVPFMGDLDF